METRLGGGWCTTLTLWCLVHCSDSLVHNPDYLVHYPDYSVTFLASLGTIELPAKLHSKSAQSHAYRLERQSKRQRLHAEHGDKTCPAFFLAFIDTGGCLSRNGQCWKETRPAGVLSLLDGGSADTAMATGSSNLETQPASTSPDIFLAQENAQRRKVIRMQPLQLCIFSGRPTEKQHPRLWIYSWQHIHFSSALTFRSILRLHWDTRCQFGEDVRTSYF